MLKHILVPLDFRFRSRAPLVTAAMLARENGADVTLLCVEDPGENLPAVDVAEFLSDAALVVLQHGAWARVQSIRGRPAHSAIGEYAAGVKADIVVMGARGRTGFASAQWRRTTEAVVANSEVAVLVIHESESRRERVVWRTGTTPTFELALVPSDALIDA
ncbi:MAG TPA: universal stress protein [Candidatus Acidoferrales bacterium]|jgi:nucleotide-binding universal stress UspA family protein|nr:universal stress protein [Candidatus Acidoferrales bacterium]